MSCTGRIVEAQHGWPHVSADVCRRDPTNPDFRAAVPRPAHRSPSSTHDHETPGVNLGRSRSLRRPIRNRLARFVTGCAAQALETSELSLVLDALVAGNSGSKSTASSNTSTNSRAWCPMTTRIDRASTPSPPRQPIRDRDGRRGRPARSRSSSARRRAGGRSPSASGLARVSRITSWPRPSRPAFRAVGEYRPVDHPESRLAFAARKAEAEGFRPVHVAINPLQDVYLSPHLPNLVFPFWEFPQIPDRDFGVDTRQNWARIARGAALVLCACRFTADAFRNAGVTAPACVVPIPVDPSSFNLPDWEPTHSWTIICRHEVLGPGLLGATGSPEPVPEGPRPGTSNRVWQTARRLFRRAVPWLSPKMVTRLTLFKRGLVASRGKHPARLAYDFLRNHYKRNLQRWLSPYALRKISNAKGPQAPLSSAAYPATSSIRPCPRDRSPSAAGRFISPCSTWATSARTMRRS